MRSESMDSSHVDKMLKICVQDVSLFAVRFETALKQATDSKMGSMLRSCSKCKQVHINMF